MRSAGGKGDSAANEEGVLVRAVGVVVGVGVDRAGGRSGAEAAAGSDSVRANWRCRKRRTAVSAAPALLL